MQTGEIVAGRFAIEALAGSGGMADVYRAIDQKSGERVALKILRISAPEDLARLAREAQALSRLAHPNIVQYVAHGTSSKDAYVAMEWVDGDTLSQRLKRGPLSLPVTLKVGRAIASALAHAHDHGIVHRDVKPSNIVLRNGYVEDPMLLDFGVARTGLAVGLTQLGTVIGTPRYMAPEQARGGQSVDSRADVFALGALMFKCVTGRAPFDGDDAIAVLAHLLFDDAPDVCALVPNVPREVGDVFLKMLAKEPRDRYADGAAVMRAIDTLDTDAIPITIATPVSSGLTLRERRLLSLMVLTGRVDAEVARTVAGSFGARAEALANGSVVVVVSGRDNASELARVSARCALELRRAMPEAPIVLATGRSEAIDEDATETMAKDGSGTRYSGVFERAAGLLHEVHEHAADDGRRPIVIDDTTAALIGADFDVARGKGGVHALRGQSAIRAHYTFLGRTTPFVGRGRELASLLATWDDVCEQGVARAMLVTGDAGLGKSRLLYEMLEAMSAPHVEPALRLRARADATSAGSPFAALGGAIRREVCGDHDDEPHEERWHKLAARVGSVVAEGETHVAEFVAEVAGLRLADPTEQVAAARRDPRLMSDRIRRSWQAWMKGETARGPVLIVLEDFQWGDLPTVKLVDDMLRDLAEEPILVLALARPDIDTVFPGMWSRVVERVPLMGLGKKAAATFVRAMLDGSNDDAVDRIVTLASGNALYLEELVRAASEGKTDAPESLLAILSSQVESLPDTERRVLRAASIFGATFWVDGVSALLVGEQNPNERVRADASARLETLAQREMVDEQSASRLAGQRELGFRNALVRDVTYAMLTEDDRRLGHAIAAEWLEGAGEMDPFVLAEHHERGAQLHRAVIEYTRSATAALDAGDFGTALDRATRAKRCGASEAWLAEVCIVAGEAHRWRGETTECKAEAQQASDLATPGSSTHFRALKLLAYAASYSGDLATLLRATHTLLAASPDESTMAEWVLALAGAANGLTVAGNTYDNELIVERLAIVPESMRTNLDVRDAIRMCFALRALRRGDFTAMIEAHAASADARLQVGDERGHWAQVSNVGFASMWLGRHEDAIAAFESARVGAAAAKLTTLELSAMQNSAYVRFCMGDLEGAIRGSREVLARHIEAPRSLALAHLCIARASIAMGDLAQAEREARAGVSSTTAPVRMYARAVLADVLLAAGRVGEAVGPSEDAIAVLRSLESLVVGDIYALLVRAEVLEASGDIESARASLALAQTLYQQRYEHLRDDETRTLFSAWSPEAARLARTIDRLAKA